MAKVSLKTTSKLVTKKKVMSVLQDSRVAQALAMIYRADMQKRFIEQSDGGKEWPYLKQLRNRNKTKSLKKKTKKARDVVKSVKASQKRATQANISLENATKKANKKNTLKALKASARSANSSLKRNVKKMVKTGAVETIRESAGEIQRQKILRDTGQLFNSLSPSPSMTKKTVTENKASTSIRLSFHFPKDRHKESDVTVSDIASWNHFGAGNLPVRRILVEPSEKAKKQIESVILSAVLK